ALDLAATRGVVEDAARRKGRVQIGFQRRFDAGFREARRRVRGGELGTVYSFQMTSCDALPPPDAYVETSGGQFVDQLIHDFDVTRWMFGEEVEELYARTPLTSVERDAPRLRSPAYPTFFVRFGDAYRAELAHFLRYARGEAENPCSAEDAMEALRIALAARRSLHERRPIGLREI